MVVLVASKFDRGDRDLRTVRIESGNKLGCFQGITHGTRLAGFWPKRLRKKLEGGGVRVAGDWVQARACIINQIRISVF